jgi:hypothetical protein
MMIITSRLVGCDSYCRGALVVQFFCEYGKDNGDNGQEESSVVALSLCGTVDYSCAWEICATLSYCQIVVCTCLLYIVIIAVRKYCMDLVKLVGCRL